MKEKEQNTIKQNYREKEEQQKLAELEKKRQREEVRKERHLKKIQERSEHEFALKIRVEERKLKIAKRKLESICILGGVFSRIKEKYLESMDDRPSTSAAVNPLLEEARVRLVEKYKVATQKLVKEQEEKVKNMKNQTPIQGLLSTHKKKEDLKPKATGVTAVTAMATATNKTTTDDTVINPFKAMAAAASEWMESMGGMFPYMPGMMPGIPAQFRPPFMGMPRGMISATVGYRGMPRMRGNLGYYGRGRGRGGYDQNYSPHRHYNEEGGSHEVAYEAAGGEDKYHPYHYPERSRYPRGRRGGYRRGGGSDHYHTKKHSHRHHRSHSRSRSRSRSRSYSRSPSRSYTRSRSRSRNRHYSKRSRGRSRSRSRSYYSRSHSRSEKTSKKLVSTRRSRTLSYSSSSRSRSHSRSHRNRSHRRSSRRHSRRSSEHSNSRQRNNVMLETEKLVRSAEVIKRAIETDVKLNPDGELNYESIHYDINNKSPNNDKTPNFEESIEQQEYKKNKPNENEYEQEGNSRRSRSITEHTLYERHENNARNILNRSSSREYENFRE